MYTIWEIKLYFKFGVNIIIYNGFKWLLYFSKLQNVLNKYLSCNLSVSLQNVND